MKNDNGWVSGFVRFNRNIVECKLEESTRYFTTACDLIET